jgi:hypothetical protein
MGDAREWRRLLGCLTLTAVCQAWLFRANVAPAADTVAFMRMARRLGAEPFADVVRAEAQHPLYPLSVAIVQRGVRAVRPADSELDRWWAAARLAANLAAVLLVIPLYGLARDLFDGDAAWWATVCFVLLPVPARALGDGLSDGLHLLWLWMGVWAACTGLNRRSPRALFASGMAAGVAFWVRPEGIVLVPVLAAVLFGSQWIAARCSRTRLTMGLACVVAGAAVVVAPYVAIKGGLTAKNSLRRVLGLYLAVRPAHPGEPAWCRRVAGPMETCRTAWRGPCTLEFEDNPLVATRQAAARWAYAAPFGWGGLFLLVGATSPVPLGAWPVFGIAGQAVTTGYAKAVMAVALEILEGAHYGFVVFLLLAWFASRRRAQAPAAYLVAALGAVFVVLLVRLHSSDGYVASRHTLVILACASPWIGRGIVQVRDTLGRAIDRLGECRGGLPTGWARTAASALVLAGVGLATLPRTLQPLHQSRHGHLQAAAWVRSHSSPDAVILDEHGIVSWYAERSRYAPAELWRAAKDSRLRFVVLEAGAAVHADRWQRRMREFVAGCGEPVARFPLFAADRRPGILVYDLARAATAETAQPHNRRAN